MFLSQRYGRDIIRKIWVECANLGIGPQFLGACETEIRAADTVGHDWNLATAMNEFSTWNYFTGQYASAAPTIRDTLYHEWRLYGYKERAAYPPIPINTMLTVTKFPHNEAITSGGFRPEYNRSGM